MEDKHINSWVESQEVFLNQLYVGIQQLNNKYSNHIINIIETLTRINDIVRVVDVGCGSGILFPIIQKHFPKLQYIGYDYSPHAIDIATKQWGSCFSLKNYKDLQQSDFQDGDILIENALADVLPNGDECIEFLLSLNQKYLLLSRIKTTEKKSYFDILQHCDIITYTYQHNYQNLITLFNTYNYNYQTFPVYENYYYNIFLMKETKNANQ